MAPGHGHNNWAIRPRLSSLFSTRRVTAVVSWQLENVLPRRYTVGGFNAEGTDIAIETLVLSHEGLSVVCERDC